MKNVSLTSRGADFKVLVIAGWVIVALMAGAMFKFWAWRPFHTGGYDIVGDFATDADADAAAIRRDWPHRLIQPEWVSRRPDLFANWTNAETAARSVVVGVVWLGMTGLLVHRYSKLSRFPKRSPNSL